MNPDVICGFSSLSSVFIPYVLLILVIPHVPRDAGVHYRALIEGHAVDYGIKEFDKEFCSPVVSHSLELLYEAATSPGASKAIPPPGGEHSSCDDYHKYRYESKPQGT
jgi:hypothetical protein